MANSKKEELVKILNDPNAIQYITSIGFVVVDKENSACAIRRYVPVHDGKDLIFRSYSETGEISQTFNLNTLIKKINEFPTGPNYAICLSRITLDWFE